MIPVVTATAAWEGLRPVAKAFGTSERMMHTFGIGSSALAARRCTRRYSSGACSEETSWAPYARSTMLSLNQYEKKFMAKDRINMMAAPCEPPKAPPTATRIPVNKAMSIVVFKVFILDSSLVEQ